MTPAPEKEKKDWISSLKFSPPLHPPSTNYIPSFLLNYSSSQAYPKIWIFYFWIGDSLQRLEDVRIRRFPLCIHQIGRAHV